MNNRTKKILITGACGNSYGAQIAKSLSLLKNSYILYGADANIGSTSDSMILDGLFKLPMASESNYLDVLIEMYKKYDIDFLIEGSEAEQRALNKNRYLLLEHGIKWISNKEDVISICTDKIEFIKFLENQKFYHPKNYNISNLEDLVYPVILKPKSHSSGSANVYIAQSLKDINAVIQLSNIPVDSFCIQEYIGTPNEEYTVGILHDKKGKFIGSATLKRDLTQSLSIKTSIINITNRKDLGEKLVISSGISQGIMMHHEHIELYCREIAENLNSTGPLNFQGRLVGDKFYVFEINPRFSGTSFMRAMAGFNEADFWINSYFNDYFEPPVFIKGAHKCYRVLKEISQ